jgi:hypothetical protein
VPGRAGDGTNAAPARAVARDAARRVEYARLQDKACTGGALTADL